MLGLSMRRPLPQRASWKSLWAAQVRMRNCSVCFPLTLLPPPPPRTDGESEAAPVDELPIPPSVERTQVLTVSHRAVMRLVVGNSMALTELKSRYAVGAHTSLARPISSF